MMLSSTITVPIYQENGLAYPLVSFLWHPETQPAKALILLFHGAGGDHHHFSAMIRPLVGAGFHVLVPDLHFHGQSRPDDNVKAPTPMLDFSTMMDDLDNLLRIVRLRFMIPVIDLIVGGLSMGGILSQACAIHKRYIWAELGYRMKGLVPIACSSVNMVFPRIPWMDMYRDAHGVSTHDVLALARQSIIASAVQVKAQKETARALALISDEALVQCFRACARAFPPPPPRKHKNNTTLSPQFDTLPPKLPTLLITGDQDEHTVTVMRAWQQLNEAHGIGESRFIVKDDAGHMVPLDQPAAVAEDIIAFFC